MGRPAAPIDPDGLRKLASKFSDEEIGKKLGFARVTVTGARKRHGIPSFTEKTGMKRREGADTHGGRKRIILFNENTFKECQDEATAYFLGLLMADGSISECGTKLELQISEPDHEIVYTFAEWIGAGREHVKRRINHFREHKPHRICLCSKRMVQSLASWGVVNAKTECLTLKRQIPRDLERHFLRGFWDGDGSIGKSHFEVGIKSRLFTRQLREMMQRVGEQLPPCRLRKTVNNEPFWIMAVASERFELLRNKMYLDAKVSISRKREKFFEHWQ